MPKICDFETCRKYANYGEHYCKPLRCRTHKEEYILVSQLCQEGNCKSRPNFNYEGELQAKFCNSHKEEGMIDIKNKTCEYPGCKTIPIYNFEEQLQGKFCSKHKVDEMINVKDKKCQYSGCKIRPNFNYEGETQAKFCNSHKEETMIDIKNKTCKHPGCKIQPNFSYKGETQSKFCNSHKEDGMISIKSKSCEYLGCKIQSNFNYEEETKGKFCNSHKEEGMIDIINKTCEYLGCKIRPNFNYKEETKGKFCNSHKEDGMINVKSKTCEYLGCKTIPIYNFKGQLQSKFCNIHKEDGMINVKDKKCKANFCLGTIANVKYKGYCSNCYQNLFPNDPLSLQMRTKTKELTVMQFININFEGFQHDKPLYTGNCDCSNRRRIDHRLLIGNTLLCVETDESQHKSYDKKDEEIRYDDLYMLHSGKFIFIRFNPDKYKNKDNKSVNPMLYTRLPILKEEIEKQMERIKKEENTELLEIIKLYYTGYN
jgi:hypothetical protein